MPGNPVNNALLTARGLNSRFRDTYSQKSKGIDPRIATLMDLDLPSDKTAELYGYRETRPYPSRQDKGQAVTRETFGAKTYEVPNYVFSMAIDWYWQDELTDQLGRLYEDASEAAENAAYHPERLFWQLLLGTSEPDLLPYVPSAPDGAALFATTAGGSARFGATDGNLLTGSGVVSAAAIRTDFYATVSQLLKFQDTKGQPLVREQVFDRKIYVIFGVQNQEVFMEAFRQAITFQLGGTDAAAGVSNTILANFGNIELWPTPRITDDDWFVAFSGTNVKPFLHQVVAPWEDNVADFANSDRSRDYNMRTFHIRGMMGAGINLPHGLLKVNN